VSSPKVRAFEQIAATATGLTVNDFLDSLANALVRVMMSTEPPMPRERALEYLGDLHSRCITTLDVNWPPEGSMQ
jgi:hypothetical protein